MSGSGIDSMYLKFLDDKQAKIFRNVDDSSIEVELPSRFIIGRKTYLSLYVRFNCYLFMWYHISF